MLVQTWTDVVVDSLQNLWIGFVDFIPSLVGAIVVFVIGWILAMALGRVAARLLQALQVDKIFDQLGVMRAVHKAGIDWEFSGFVGWLVKWFLLIAFFLAAADILGLSAVAGFLGAVLGYIPNILVASLILLIAALLAEFLDKLVKASMQAAEFMAPNLVGLVIRWSIWIFAFVAVLDQLGVATTIVNTFFMGLVAMLAVGGGLALGLGGKDVAKEWIEKVSKELK